MRHQPEPWKWPTCIGLALLLFCSVVWFTPASWIQALLSLRQLEFTERTVRPAWLEIQNFEPVTQVRWEPEPDDPERKDELPVADIPADWWQNAWRIHLAEDTAGLLQSAPLDTTPAYILDLVAPATDLLAATTPDSSLALQLALIMAADQLHAGLSGMKAMLRQITHARALRDINSRAAQMFDEPMLGEIIVTDPD